MTAMTSRFSAFAKYHPSGRSSFRQQEQCWFSFSDCFSLTRYIQQCKDIRASAEEPRWTSFATRFQQRLRHTTLRSASALGAPGYCKLGAHSPAMIQSPIIICESVVHCQKDFCDMLLHACCDQFTWKLPECIYRSGCWDAGLVEVCKVVDVTYHHRLPESCPTAAPAVNSADSSGSVRRWVSVPDDMQPVSEPPAGLAVADEAAGARVPAVAATAVLAAAGADNFGSAVAAAAPTVAQADVASAIVPAADAFATENVATTTVSVSGGANPVAGSVLDEEDGVDVPIQVRRPAWFVRATLQQWRPTSGAVSLWTTVDIFIDAGVPEWLISKCAFRQGFFPALMHVILRAHHRNLHLPCVLYSACKSKGLLCFLNITTPSLVSILEWQVCWLMCNAVVMMTDGIIC